MAKIIKVNDNYILFDNDELITFAHRRDCCEKNYADFGQLEELAFETDFNTNKMKFEPVDGSGFRFGNENKMFFVPCYSEQSGYYSDELDIIYHGDYVMSITCEEI